MDECLMVRLTSVLYANLIWMVQVLLFRLTQQLKNNQRHKFTQMKLKNMVKAMKWNQDFCCQQFLQRFSLRAKNKRQIEVSESGFQMRLRNPGAEQNLHCSICDLCTKPCAKCVYTNIIVIANVKRQQLPRLLCIDKFVRK